MNTQTKKTRKLAGRRTARQLVRKGDLLRRTGEFLLAEEIYRRATRLEPSCSEAWADLGCLLIDSRRYSEAGACFHRVLGAQSANGDNAADLKETVRLLAEIVARRSSWIRGQFSLACGYELLNDYPHARAHGEATLRLDRSLECAVESLFASIYWKHLQFDQAVAAANRAIEANPAYFFAHVIRGRSLASLGRIRESLKSFRRAIEIKPDPEPHSMLIYRINLLPETTPEMVYTEACRFNELYAAPLANQIRPHANDPDPERPLKIGYVSPDLYNHAVMKFVPPILEHHDSSRFNVFVYSVGAESDELTESLRGSTQHYISLTGPYATIAERVRADGIDILVDLFGHTNGPRLLAFALKPAPVQVSWIGAPMTTGIAGMDYFLGDPQLPCPGTEHLFTEAVYRLPRSVCCYRSFGSSPVAPAPCLERGYITFGCYNNPGKVTPEVGKLWSAIMHLVPESRLLFKSGGMDKEAMNADFRRQFTENGIPAERLTFEGSVPPAEYLASYANIDIALDPFPYNGGSTTLDSLWMGVPVVTLAGRLSVQRGGASVLTAVGLPYLIAQTPEEYIKIALYLAAFVPKMPTFRNEIRQYLRQSPVMDEVGITRDVENAYREMWRSWCRTRN